MKPTTPLGLTLKRMGIGYNEVADGTGLNVRTIYNVAAGNSTSLNARKKITNFLGKQIWADIPVSQRHATFRPGTQIEFSSAEEAREAAADELAAGIVTQRGRVVTFIKAATFVIGTDTPKRRATN